MASTLFWVLVVVAVVVAAYLLCDGKKVAAVVAAVNGTSTPTTTTTSTTVSTTPATSAPVRLPFSRRQATLTVEHNEPLLGSLFSREVESLPDGISREDFDRAVNEYQQQHLKEVEIKIPRSLNFNYEKYAAEQESMRRNVSATASKFVQREEVGGISDRLAKGVPVQPQTLAARTFMKKVVAKRR